ncbi:Gfo/Idh/MocA family oxidoreductase [Streptomyces sp. NPDC006645]|uniref:Gfo/Idh/MocA family protein n=1 Tax=unclassified Streptomyces TaxID=2593676 RepID=UPI0033A989D3
MTPPTSLGAGVRSARGAVDDGLIGAPVAAAAFITASGLEHPYPASELNHRPGAGSLLDLGPVCLRALVHLLGPVSRVTGATSGPRAERTADGAPGAEEGFETEPDTQVTGVLEHTDGPLTTLVIRSGSRTAGLPRIEVHGTEGSLSLPGLDGGDGPVALHRADGEWEPLPETALAEDLVDRPHRADQPHRAPDELARHALDVMLTLFDAARDGVWLPVRGDRARPEAVRT